MVGVLTLFCSGGNMKKTVGAAALIAIAMTLTACAGSPVLEVTTAPPATDTAEETETSRPTPEPEGDPGTRQSPLAVGEARKISAESMWVVSASAPTEVHDGYVVLPLNLGLDWEASRAQVENAGQAWTLDQDGIDPLTSLIVEFVTSEGRAYNTMDNFDVTIPNELWRVGTVYPPLESVSANVAVSVPAAEVEGGTWVVKNLNGDSVFLGLR